MPEPAVLCPAVLEVENNYHNGDTNLIQHWSRTNKNTFIGRNAQITDMTCLPDNYCNVIRTAGYGLLGCIEQVF